MSKILEITQLFKKEEKERERAFVSVSKEKQSFVYGNFEDK